MEFPRWWFGQGVSRRSWRGLSWSHLTEGMQEFTTGRLTRSDNSISGCLSWLYTSTYWDQGEQAEPCGQEISATSRLALVSSQSSCDYRLTTGASISSAQQRLGSTSHIADCRCWEKGHQFSLFCAAWRCLSLSDVSNGCSEEVRKIVFLM